jgi:hypothetical protein
MPLKSVYNPNLGFIEHKNCIFEYYREVQTIKKYYLALVLSGEYFSDDLFKAAP